MTRAELIRMFVLNSFCDDYEDIEQIMEHTGEVGPKCGLTISREDIIQALRELIDLRYARAWDLTQPKREPTKEYQGMPTPEEIGPLDPWFFRTSEGLSSSTPLSTDRLWNENGKSPRGLDLTGSVGETRGANPNVYA